MKTMTVRLPEALVSEIEAECRTRGVRKSDVVRERLSRADSSRAGSVYDRIRDLVGSVEGLPADLSARRKHYLRASGYGQDRHRRQ